MTRDEIIKGLEKEIRRIHKEPKRKMLGILMTVDEAEDLVVLLKKQEPVKPIRQENWWECPSCSGNIVANMQHCPGCGRPVEWDA